MKKLIQELMGDKDCLPVKVTTNKDNEAKATIIFGESHKVTTDFFCSFNMELIKAIDDLGLYAEYDRKFKYLLVPKAIKRYKSSVLIKMTSNADGKKVLGIINTYKKRPVAFIGITMPRCMAKFIFSEDLINRYSVRVYDDIIVIKYSHGKV